MTRILVIAIVFALGACASHSETCQSSGYTLGTPEFANCVSNLDQRARDRAAAAALAICIFSFPHGCRCPAGGRSHPQLRRRHERAPINRRAFAEFFAAAG